MSIGDDNDMQEQQEKKNKGGDPTRPRRGKLPRSGRVDYAVPPWADRPAPTESAAPTESDKPTSRVPDGFAVKKDAGKPRFELLSPDFLRGIAEVMTHSAESGKYDDRNWEKGMLWSKVFASLQRHSWAFWGGEDIDPDSGLPHVWHIGCCAMFLSHYFINAGWCDIYNNMDDRPDKLINPHDTQ